MPSLRDQFQSALLARGESVVGARTTKYLVFTAKTFGSDKFFFLGPNGALRFGRNSSHTVVVSDRLRQKLLAEALVPGTGAASPAELLATL